MPDPVLEKRGEGGKPQFGLNIKGWGGAGPPSPSLGFATGVGIPNLTLSRVQGMKKKIRSSWHNILRLDYKMICFLILTHSSESLTLYKLFMCRYDIYARRRVREYVVGFRCIVYKRPL